MRSLFHNKSNNTLFDTRENSEKLRNCETKLNTQIKFKSERLKSLAALN